MSKANTLNIAVLGASDSGKSLFIRCIANMLDRNAEERYIEVGEEKVQVPAIVAHVDINGRRMKIAFVEIPTEIYDNPDAASGDKNLQIYLKSLHGAIVLFDHTNVRTRAIVERWVETLKHNREMMFPISVVGTKCQQAASGAKEPHFGGNKYGKVGRSNIDLVEGGDNSSLMKPCLHILRRINSTDFQGKHKITLTPAITDIFLVPEQQGKDLQTFELAQGSPKILGRQHLRQESSENKEVEGLMGSISRESCQVTLQDDGTILVKRLGKQDIALLIGNTRKVLKVKGDDGVLPLKNGKIQLINGVEDLTWSVKIPASHFEHGYKMLEAQLEFGREDEEDPGLDDAFSRFSLIEEKKEETDDEETDEEDINTRLTQEHFF